MAGIISYKGKKGNVERSTGTSSEDYSYEQPESLDESDVISEEDSGIEGYSEKTDEKWYEGDEQEPDDEPNTPEEDPNNEPNLPDEEPNESQEEPNEQWL